MVMCSESPVRRVAGAIMRMVIVCTGEPLNGERKSKKFAVMVYMGQDRRGFYIAAEFDLIHSRHLSCDLSHIYAPVHRNRPVSVLRHSCLYLLKILSK